MAKRLSNHTLQSRLNFLAALFIWLYALALTIAPAVKAHSWTAPLRWSHWLGVLVWTLTLIAVKRAISEHLPETDPFLLPISWLLIGWGLMSIWRLQPLLGLKQTVWLGLAALLLFVGSRHEDLLTLLQKYKYLWLTSGLILTAFTLLFGSNPAGYGPRLWLQFGDLYFQPSEPLKLLLAVYLAAYFASAPRLHATLFPYIIPTILLTLTALGLLITQRDLGTASVFLIIYLGALYLASGKKRVLAAGLLIISASGAAGYAVSPLVQSRIEAWLNPWQHAQDSAYQIIQALIALANGGLLGRGPGLGYPTLVPVAASDFIYPAIIEASGFLGGVALLGLWGILFTRGFRLALKASSTYHRLLAAILTLYFGAQTIFIIGGTLRILPLTGITLPFMSYGGSSLLTASFALLILLHIGQKQAGAAPPVTLNNQPYRWLHLTLIISLALLALGTGWWSIWRSQALLARHDNPRRVLISQVVPRGNLMDRHSILINMTSLLDGTYQRSYLYSPLMPVVGYTHPVYGESGLEASLDDYLRGERGYPASLVWQYHLLYGQPPPGLAIRLTLDMALQRQADAVLGPSRGAIILINAQNGEILAMASHPFYDPALLDTSPQDLGRDEASPLLNRATQGLYPLPDALWQPFADAGLPPAQQSLRPATRLPDSPSQTGYISPLALAVDTAILTSSGYQPAAHIVLSVKTPQGWQPLPPLDTARQWEAIQTSAILTARQISGTFFWAHSAQVNPTAPLTWVIGGTLSDWPGAPLAVVCVFEDQPPAQPETCVQSLLEAATR